MAQSFEAHSISIKTLEELGVPTVIKEFQGDAVASFSLPVPPVPESTTLAALVDYINRNFSRHIVTIEEPIEFVHRNQRSIITQREVPEHAASFPAGLKAALREDADIVLVGEMRDLETISLMLTAAETGLLVFGTLHTNNSRKTVDRIVDVFPVDQQAQVRTMLAASLRGVIAQMLLKGRTVQADWRSMRSLFRTARFRQSSGRRNPEASGRDRGRKKRRHAVHGRRDLGATGFRNGFATRGLHEGHRQTSV